MRFWLVKGRAMGCHTLVDFVYVFFGALIGWQVGLLLQVYMRASGHTNNKQTAPVHEGALQSRKSGLSSMHLLMRCFGIFT